MKRILLLFTGIFLLSLIAEAQRPGGYGGGSKPSSIKGKISGQIIDSETGSPVSYASVAAKKGDKLINGTITEDDGTFKIIVPVDTYTIIVSFVGYEPLSTTAEMTERKPDLNLGTVSIIPNTTQLDEVVVEGEKELIENKIDKIVYNAEQDVANAGGDASEVLRRAPLLNVDIEGNVSLRGSNNVQILINGKPSSMFASNPGDALKAIPADNIKSVEVITNPSAKYDGEGTAGIINIITKKSTPQGFSGNLNASLGNLSNRGVLSINAGRGRFGFNASGSAYYSPEREGSFEFYREDFVGNQSRILKEEGPNFSDRLGFFGTANAFYDFNAFHSLSTSFRLRGFSSDRDNEVNGSYVDQINNINQEYFRSTETSSLFSGYEWSLDYIYDFPKSKNGQQLSVSYKIDGNTQDQDYSINQFDLQANDQSLFIDEQNLNDGNNTENTIQVDYVHPFSDKIKLEVGGKTILRDVDSDFDYDTLNIMTGNYVTDRTRSDIFFYDQDVLAGYFSSTFKFGSKYGLIAGMRYEQTKIQGEFQEQVSPFENDYENFLPSVILSRKLGKFNTLKASYSRRIQRPSLRVINPYVQLDNNRSQTFGNPDLEPELTDQYELSYGTFVKKFSINAALFYKRTTDIIESYLTIEDNGFATTTFRNIGTNDSYGVNLFTSVTLFEIATIRGGLNVYTYNGQGIVEGQQLERNAVVWDGNINGNVKLKNDFIIDVFGFYRAPRQTLQGTNPSFSIMVFGARKEFSEKFSLGVRIVEPFFADKNFGGELNGENFIQTTDTNIPFRSFGINLTYKFGKLDFNQRSRRSKINNQDQESGDDGQQNF